MPDRSNAKEHNSCLKKKTRKSVIIEHLKASHKLSNTRGHAKKLF